ncbi:hypothetical protein PTKU46_91270 [Paraburkholderia terrae]
MMELSGGVMKVEGKLYLYQIFSITEKWAPPYTGPQTASKKRQHQRDGPVMGRWSPAPRRHSHYN